MEGEAILSSSESLYFSSLIGMPPSQSQSVTMAQLFPLAVVGLLGIKALILQRITCI